MLGHTLIKAGTIRLANLSSQQMTNIDHSIIRVSIDYSMTMASELRFTVIDFNNEMTKKNYFVIGRDVVYTTQTACQVDSFDGVESISAGINYINLLFEIAEVSISQGPGNTPQVEVTCYSKAIQQMKRDRKPGEIKGSGSEYVKRAARKYGLRCFAEKSSQKVTINKASGDEQAESLWDVLSGIASEAKFVLFEADGILFFASQKFLLNKWGSNAVSVEQKGKKGKPSKFITEKSIPIVNWKDSWTVNQGSVYSSTVTAPAFELIEYPTFTTSANDPLDVTGSFSIARENGSKFRPGMTIELIGFPGEIDDKYLVDSVAFEDKVPDPVQISFRKLEKKPKDIKDIPVGKKFKQRAIFDTSFSEYISIQQIGSKNSKQNRPNTQSDSIRVSLGISSEDLPENQIMDPRVSPLPSILDQQVYPRYDAISDAGNEKLLATGNIDMYSRPTKLVDGKITTLAQLVVENVTEPGFNDDNPYVAIIPRVYVDGGGEPQVYSVATASSAFISAMSTNSEAEFIAKMADLESATDYVKLVNHQQLLVTTSRFGADQIPETSIYPLPTDSEEQNYPYMSTLVSQGNIDLYSMPAGLLNGKPVTFYPYTYSRNGNEVIISGIKAVGDSGKLMTKKEALSLSKNTNSTMGTVPIEHLSIYIELLIEQQLLIIDQRFNGDYGSLGDL